MELTPDEIADRTIEFMEEIGPALQPWQATTLRAMLAYPVGTRFVVSHHVNTPESYNINPMSHAIANDLNRLYVRRICKCDPFVDNPTWTCPVHGDPR